MRRRILGTCRRRHSVARGGARPTANSANDRLSQQPIAGRLKASFGGISARARGFRICRRQNSQDRISLGQWAVRSIEEIGRRTGCATPCHYCGGRRGTFRSSGKVRHDIHSHHFHRGRFRKRGNSRESESAGRERHRCRSDERRAHRKATWSAGAAPPVWHPYWLLDQQKGRQPSCQRF